MIYSVTPRLFPKVTNPLFSGKRRFLLWPHKIVMNLRLDDEASQKYRPRARSFYRFMTGKATEKLKLDQEIIRRPESSCQTAPVYMLRSSVCTAHLWVIKSSLCRVKRFVTGGEKVRGRFVCVIFDEETHSEICRLCSWISGARGLNRVRT